LVQDLTQVAERPQVQRAVRAHLAPQRADLDREGNRAPVGAPFFCVRRRKRFSSCHRSGTLCRTGRVRVVPYLRRWQRPLGLGRC
jgi:hypothetical protein